jgi:hypothetical protein
MRTGAVSAILFFTLTLGISASQSVPNSADALLDLLVWGTDVVTITPQAYEPALRTEIQKYFRQAMAYRSNVPGAAGGEAEKPRSLPLGEYLLTVALDHVNSSHLSSSADTAM